MRAKCGQLSEKRPRFSCSLKLNHRGNTHVALGGDDFVYEVWVEEEVEVKKVEVQQRRIYYYEEEEK